MSLDVPRTILEQLGGNKFIVMTGAKNFVGDGNTLRMTLPRNGSKANRLWVTLNGKDLYDMRFFRYTAPKLSTKTYTFTDEKISDEKIYEDVYFDQMQEIFTAHTKMYTHL